MMVLCLLIEKSHCVFIFPTPKPYLELYPIVPTFLIVCNMNQLTMNLLHLSCNSANYLNHTNFLQIFLILNHALISMKKTDIQFLLIANF